MVGEGYVGNRSAQDIINEYEDSVLPQSMSLKDAMFAALKNIQPGTDPFDILKSLPEEIIKNYDPTFYNTINDIYETFDLEEHINKRVEDFKNQSKNIPESMKGHVSDFSDLRQSLEKALPRLVKNQIAEYLQTGDRSGLKSYFSDEQIDKMMPAISKGSAPVKGISSSNRSSVGWKTSGGIGT